MWGPCVLVSPQFAETLSSFSWGVDFSATNLGVWVIPTFFSLEVFLPLEVLICLEVKGPRQKPGTCPFHLEKGRVPWKGEFKNFSTLGEPQGAHYGFGEIFKCRCSPLLIPWEIIWGSYVIHFHNELALHTLSIGIEAPLTWPPVLYHPSSPWPQYFYVAPLPFVWPTIYDPPSYMNPRAEGWAIIALNWAL